jgi:hypothetical protein
MKRSSRSLLPFGRRRAKWTRQPLVPPLAVEKRIAGVSLLIETTVTFGAFPKFPGAV